MQIANTPALHWDAGLVIGVVARINLHDTNRTVRRLAVVLVQPFIAEDGAEQPIWNQLRVDAMIAVLLSSSSSGNVTATTKPTNQRTPARATLSTVLMHKSLRQRSIKGKKVRFLSLPAQAANRLIGALPSSSSAAATRR